jgi:Activator of Hsp90 ATPase homolog 1-like protein
MRPTRSPGLRFGLTCRTRVSDLSGCVGVEGTKTRHAHRFATRNAMGEEYPNNGFFRAFDAPNRIAFSETGAAEGMTTSIDFVDLGDGRCETICRQTNVPGMYRSPEAQAGMNAALDRGVTFIESL